MSLPETRNEPPTRPEGAVGGRRGRSGVPERTGPPNSGELPYDACRSLEEIAELLRHRSRRILEAHSMLPVDAAAGRVPRARGSSALQGVRSVGRTLCYSNLTDFRRKYLPTRQVPCGEERSRALSHGGEANSAKNPAVNPRQSSLDDLPPPGTGDAWPASAERVVERSTQDQQEQLEGPRRVGCQVGRRHSHSNSVEDEVVVRLQLASVQL